MGSFADICQRILPVGGCFESLRIAGGAAGVKPAATARLPRTNRVLRAQTSFPRSTNNFHQSEGAFEALRMVYGAVDFRQGTNQLDRARTQHAVF